MRSQLVQPQIVQREGVWSVDTGFVLMEFSVLLVPLRVV